MTDRDFRAELGHVQVQCRPLSGCDGVSVLDYAFAMLAEIERLRSRISEAKTEQNIFDDDARDRQSLIDRIADLIGLPHNEELDFSAVRQSLSLARRAGAKEMRRRAAQLASSRYLAASHVDELSDLAAAIRLLPLEDGE